MKTTRPVFESYSEFVNSLYSVINEAEGEQTPFEVILTNFQKKMDQTSKDGFSAASTILLFSSEAKEVDNSEFEKIFTDFTTDLTSITKKSNREDEDVKMGGMIGELKEFKYDLIINGKVMLTKPVANRNSFTTNYSVLSDSDVNKAGEYVSIFDLLTDVNLDNLSRFRINSNMYPNLGEPAKLGKEKGKFYWSSDQEDDTVSNTGASGQKVISDDSSGILFSEKSSEVLSSLQSDRLKANTSKDKTLYKTLVLYGVGDYLPLDPANTNTIPNTYIKKELVEVSGTPKTYNVSIDGGPNMFPQGQSTFTKGKDDYINKTLTDALAPLIGLPTKITILGGASNEGTEDINKKLVDARAAAIKTRYESLYPGLKGKIEAKSGDYSKIQTADQVKGTTPDEKEASYKEYRKVYIAIEGVIKGEPKTVESALEEKTKIPAGSATIKQYVISLPFTSSKIS
jgi:hypothetical protein